MNKPSKKLLVKLILIATTTTIAIGQVHADNSVKQKSMNSKSKPVSSIQKDSIKAKQPIKAKAGATAPKAAKQLKQRSVKPTQTKTSRPVMAAPKAAQPSKQRNVKPTQMRSNGSAVPSQPTSSRTKRTTRGLDRSQSNLKEMKELNRSQRLERTNAVKQPGLARPTQRSGHGGKTDLPRNYDNTIGRGEVVGTQPSIRTHPGTSNSPRVSQPTTPGKIGSPSTSGSTGSPATAGSTKSPGSAPRRARLSTSARGEESFVLSNGRHVDRSVGGSKGQPNKNGGVTYSDGRRADPGPKGSTVFYNADGSVHSTTPAAQEAQPATASDGKLTFQLSNGQQVPRTLNDGTTGTPDSGGGVTYGDGRRISVDADTNETVGTNANGSEQSRDAAPLRVGRAKATESSGGEPTYELSNGQQVPRTLNDGTTGKPDSDGGVTYGDGRRIHVDPATGETVGTNSNGTEQSRDTAPPPIESTGTGRTTESHASDGTATYQLGNGQHTPRTNEDGSPAQLNPDGSVTYSRVGDNGQIETSTVSATDDGMTVIESDGAMTFHLGPKDRNQDATVGIDGGTGPKLGPSGSVSNGGNKDSNDDDSGSDDSGSDDSDSDNSDSDNSDSDNSDSDDSGSDDSDSDDSGSDDSDSDDSGSDDSGSDDSGGDDADTEEGATEYREGGSSYNHAPTRKLADDFVARKSGQKRDVESITPEPCGEDDGSGRVAEPGPEGEENCVPGGMPGSGDDDEEDSQGPNAENDLPVNEGISEEDRRGMVINPTGTDRDNMPDSNHALDTLEGIEGVINRGPGR